MCLMKKVCLGFSGGLDSKEPACNVGDLGWEDPLDEGMATHSIFLFQYSYLENLHGPRSLAGYSLWGCKEPDTTERLSHARSYRDFI